MKIELRNVNHNKKLSEETECFSAVIYADGIKVGEADNRGHGGPTMLHFSSPLHRDNVEAYAATLPPLELGHGLAPIPMNAEHLVDELLHDHLQMKQIRSTLVRWCKTMTVYKVKGATAEQFVTIKRLFSPTEAAWVRQTEGDKLDYIVNERLADGTL